MSNLTEIEIFAKMAECLRLAAEDCDELAVNYIRGPVYEKLRAELGFIEGCCQQASAHREDTRWLPIGRLMAEVHAKAGGWLRGYKIDGEWVKPGQGELNQNFVELAKHLRSLLVVCERTRNERTGTVGAILPETPRPFLREDRPHRVVMPDNFTQAPSGLFIPASAA